MQTTKKVEKLFWRKNRAVFIATTLDHEPPIDSFPSPELWVGSLRPSCASCNYSRGAKYGNAKRKAIKNSREW